MATEGAIGQGQNPDWQTERLACLTLQRWACCRDACRQPLPSIAVGRNDQWRCGASRCPRHTVRAQRLPEMWSKCDMTIKQLLESRREEILRIAAGTARTACACSVRLLGVKRTPRATSIFSWSLSPVGRSSI